MRWLSAMLDNIFFTCTRKTEGVWHLYYIYNTLWRAAYHLKKSEKKEKQHEKKGKLAGKNGKVTGGNSGNSTKKKGKLAGKNGKDNWKYRERNRGTPARLQKSKGPGTANFRKKFRNKRKPILKMRKTAEGRKSKDAPGWRRKTGKRQNGRRFSSKATE